MTQAAILAASGSPGTTTGFKNRIINGNMVINQRGFSGSVDTTNPYTLDRWQGVCSASSKFTVSQNAGSVTPPVGFTNYLGVTSSAATSVGGSDYYFLSQYIEGYNIADLGWGTANAKTITISFWVRSSLTGTFGGAVRNYDSDRSYPFSYTISAANTWEQKTVTVAGDTTGTWGTTSGIGIRLSFGLGIGSTYSTTANAWAAGNYVSPTGATQVVATNGATFYVTGVQLEVGTTATNFDFRSYGTELQLCQRYFQYSGLGIGSGGGSTGTNLDFGLLVQMRSAPSVSQTGVYVITDGYTADYTQSSASTSLIASTQTGAFVSVGNFSGLTVGRVYFSRFSNTNYLTFSAEL